MLSLLRRETRGKIRDPSHKLVIIHPDEPGVLSAAEFRSVQEKEDDILLESRSAALPEGPRQLVHPELLILEPFRIDNHVPAGQRVYIVLLRRLDAAERILQRGDKLLLEFPVGLDPAVLHEVLAVVLLVPGPVEHIGCDLIIGKLGRETVHRRGRMLQENP